MRTICQEKAAEKKRAAMANASPGGRPPPISDVGWGSFLKQASFSPTCNQSHRDSGVERRRSINDEEADREMQLVKSAADMQGAINPQATEDRPDIASIAQCDASSPIEPKACEPTSMGPD